MPKISLTLVDAYGRSTKKLYEVETQADIASYTSVMTDLVLYLDGITELQVIRADLILDGLVAGTGPAVAGSSVDAGATFSGYIDGGNGKKASHKTPAPRPNILNSDGTVDMADPDVTNYLGQFMTAGPLQLSDGETISSWIRGTLDK